MNENIAYYCKKFIENEESPQFAIFIKGEWGCGKTYFVNQLIEEYTAKENSLTKDDILYISIFGVNSSSEIDNKIFQALHPILSSKGMQLAGTVLRTALKLGANIDLNNDGKSDTSISFGGIPRTDSDIKISNIKKKLLIIDDFERALIDPSQIFGYFSEIISQSNCKVIFVGNEEQIADQEDKIIKKFKRIKEKTIGLEFKIMPDIDNAISRFLDEIGFSPDYIEEIKLICLEVINIIECKNLRTIRQALYNLNILINSIDESIKDQHKEDVIRIFLSLYIQNSLGIISDKDSINDIIIAFIKYRIVYSKYLATKEKEAKANIFYGYMDKYIPLSNCWYQIIFNGNYSKTYISGEYEKENIVNAKESPKNLFILLNSWRNMNNKDFKKIIKTITRELHEGVYLHPGEILNYYSIMALFSKWELIPYKVIDIFEDIKKIIYKYRKKIIAVENWAMLEDSYGGWGYSNDIPEIPELKKILKNVTKENLEKEIKELLKEDIKKLSSDAKEFCRSIIHVNGNSKYYMKPLLKLVDINKFYNTMSNLSIEDQNLIVYSLEERYGKKYSNGDVCQEYKDDLPNLIILRDRYISKSGNTSYNPISLMKKNIAESLSSLVLYFIEKTKT